MYEGFFQLAKRPFVAAPTADRYFPAASIEAARLTLARVIDRAEGALIHDVDGNRLIDYYLGAGPIILGHTPAPLGLTPAPIPLVAPVAPSGVTPAPTLAQSQLDERLAFGSRRGPVLGSMGAVVVLVVALGGWYATRGPVAPEVATSPVTPLSVPSEPLKVVEPVAVVGPERVKLTMVTTPSNAQVLVDGALIGMTPLLLSWEKGRSATFVFQLEGRAPERRTVAPQTDLVLEISLKPSGAAASPKAGKPKKEAKQLLDDPYGDQVKDLQESPY